MNSFMALVGPQVAEEPPVDAKDVTDRELLTIPRRFGKGDRVVCNVGGRYGWIAGTIQAKTFDSQSSHFISQASLCTHVVGWVINYVRNTL